MRTSCLNHAGVADKVVTNDDVAFLVCSESQQHFDNSRRQIALLFFDNVGYSVALARNDCDNESKTMQMKKKRKLGEQIQIKQKKSVKMIENEKMEEGIAYSQKKKKQNVLGCSISHLMGGQPLLRRGDLHLFSLSDHGGLIFVILCCSGCLS